MMLSLVRDFLCLIDGFAKPRLVGSPESQGGVHLPGSHGHIFPWDPPAFGIPDEVLVILAKTLQADAVRLAIEKTSERANRSGWQSSPTSESDDEFIEARTFRRQRV